MKINPPEANKPAPKAKSEPAKPKTVADAVAPKSKSSGMTPDEIKIMLAEQHRKEIERRNGMKQ
jgi:hypothetical protein